MVSLGTFFSAFWILAVNSWMQTPAGFAVNEIGQFIPVDWWQIVFNPSFPYRLVHMLLAASLSTSFLVGATCALHLLRGVKTQEMRIGFSMAMWMASIVAPIQIYAGDLHGLNTLEYQPRKVAAMEGHFETRKGAPLILFGLPDTEAGLVRGAIEIPQLGSLILTHSLDGEVRGLNSWPKEQWPNVAVVFWSFRIMVALGFLMFVIGLISLFLRVRKKLYDAPRFHQLVKYAGASGIIALLAGWITTEVGRQPYTVYNLLLTSESASPIATPALLGSFSAFVVVYTFVFGAGIFYLFRQLRQVPDIEPHPPELLENAITLGGGDRWETR